MSGDELLEEKEIKITAPRGFDMDAFEQMRKKLLNDPRSSLLNMGLTRSRGICRLVDELPDQIAEKLIGEGKAMQVVAVPEPTEKELINQGYLGKDDEGEYALELKPYPSASDWAKIVGINSAYEMPLPTVTADDDRHSDSKLQCLMYSSEMSSSLRTLHREARSSIEETGNNILFLSLGVLSWFDSKDSDRVRHAPLFLIPITLERTKIRLIEHYKVRYTTEDIIPNLTLIEKLGSDFGMVMPSLTTKDGGLVTPEKYFAQITSLIKRKQDAAVKRWSVKRFATIGKLSLGKLLMFRDLDPARWPEGEEGLLHSHVLKEHFKKQKKQEAPNSNANLGEYVLDEVDQLHQDFPMVDDADSSQMSVVIDAAQGENLVVQGPPGTGKSQTITNLIATLLNNDCSILFVAEKQAALQVVKRRLDKLGLGDFCLDLHSDKAQKAMVLESIKHRYEKTAEYKKASSTVEYDAKIARIEKAQEELQDYVVTVGQQWHKSTMTVDQILSKAVRYRLEVGDEELYDVIKPTQISSETFTKIWFQEQEDMLREFCGVLVGVMEKKPRGDLAHLPHPWAGVDGDVMLRQKEVVKSLQSWTDSLETLSEKLMQTSRDIDLKIDEDTWSIDEAAKLVQSWSNIPGMVGSQAAKFMPALGNFNKSSAEDLRKWMAEVDSNVRFMKSIDGVIKSDATDGLFEIVSEMKRQGINPSVSPNELALKLSTFAELLNDFDALATFHVKTARELPNDLATSLPLTIAGAEALLSLITIAAELPEGLVSMRDDAFNELSLTQALMKMKARSEELEKKRRDAALIFVNNENLDLKILKKHLSILKEASFFSWFNPEWYAARKVAKSCLLNKTSFSVPESISGMSGYIDCCEGIDEFESSDKYKPILPKKAASLDVYFKGMDTDFDSLLTLSRWYDTVRDTFGEGFGDYVPFGTYLRSSDGAVFRALRKLDDASNRKRLDDIKVGLETVGEFFPEFQKFSQSESTLDNARDVFDKHFTQVSDVRTGLSKFDGTLVDLAELLVTWKGTREFLTANDSESLNTNLFDGALDLTWDGSSEAPRDLKIADSICGYFEDLADLPKEFSNAITAAAGTAGRFFEPHKKHIKELANTENQLRKGYLKSAGCDLDAWLGTSDIAVKDVIARNKLAFEDQDSLLEYLRFKQSKEQLSNHGFSGLVERVFFEATEQSTDAKATDGKSQSTIYDRAVSLINFGVYHFLSLEILQTLPKDFSYKGDASMSALRRRFAEADTQLMEVQRKRVAANCAQWAPPAGNSGSRVGELTEFTLLQHEMKKKKAHIAMRRLIERAGKSIQTLKPCFMMSPMSVAKYLKPGQMKFDVVVMDEASQIKPEYALSSLARGKQAIIVGDDKQLPPTSFFEKKGQELDDSDDQNVVEDSESILDAFTNKYKTRVLKFHYRSRHPDLIAFSNHHFYGNELIVFPSPVDDVEQCGISFDYVPEGRFLKGVNQVESKRVVERIKHHLTSFPDKSIGVVAMNESQKSQIEGDLERERDVDKAFEAAYKRNEQTADPLFVKNLENVQGDERDTILISFTYGRSEKKAEKMSQRFGPINYPNGWRRLNVLFTRSREKVEVISSMRSIDIDADDDATLGKRSLKEYLQYAADGILDGTGSPTDEEPDSDFEIAVMRLLEEKGFACTPQYGVAGYRIDIVVKDPGNPSNYLMAIECDGATYHSSKSSRDRDITRQRVLESLDWKVRRIWSTDWFANPEAAIEGILRELAQDATPMTARATEPARQKVEPRTLTQESSEQTNDAVVESTDLESALKSFNDNEIIPAFPDTPEGKRLLRPQMLKKFVSECPFDRDEFVEAFPAYLRHGTAADEAGRFLDDILDIVKRVYLP